MGIKAISFKVDYRIHMAQRGLVTNSSGRG